MADPIPEQPTQPANPDPKPISLSESGNPVGELTPAPQPAQTHEPIAIGNNSSGVSADTPQIISSPSPASGMRFIDTSPQVPETTQTPPPTETPAVSHTPTPVDVSGTAFTGTSTPPPEKTIAPEVPVQPQTPEVPNALARTGFINKLKGMLGK